MLLDSRFYLGRQPGRLGWMERCEGGLREGACGFYNTG